MSTKARLRRLIIKAAELVRTGTSFSAFIPNVADPERLRRIIDTLTTEQLTIVLDSSLNVLDGNLRAAAERTATSEGLAGTPWMERVLHITATLEKKLAARTHQELARVMAGESEATALIQEILAAISTPPNPDPP
ncbi:MAG: hypothetical protein ABUJ98_10630 [Hyphomicrobium sp.]